MMLRCPPRLTKVSVKALKWGPPTRPISRTSGRVRFVRAFPIVVGLGVLAGASVYLFYPNISRSAPTSTRKTLSSSHFTPATVTSNEPCGPDAKLLELTIPPHLVPPRNFSDSHFTPIWSVFIKDDDIQVERPYTPLEGIDEHGRMLFWIKKYPTGEVGRWLHSKNLSEQVELRGPLATWPWKDDAWDEVVMISGGTGITPFYQLLHSLITLPFNLSQNTRFILLHSSRSLAQLPPPRILDTLSSFASQHPDKFTFHLFVDFLDEPSDHDLDRIVQIGRIGKSAIEQTLDLHINRSWWHQIFSRKVEAVTPPKKRLFLVCGPEPMINAIAGPYGRNFSQGSVGGILGEMGFSSEEVRKL